MSEDVLSPVALEANSNLNQIRHSFSMSSRNGKVCIPYLVWRHIYNVTAGSEDTFSILSYAT